MPTLLPKRSTERFELTYSVRMRVNSSTADIEVQRFADHVERELRKQMRPDESVRLKRIRDASRKRGISRVQRLLRRKK